METRHLFAMKPKLPFEWLDYDQSIGGGFKSFSGSSTIAVIAFSRKAVCFSGIFGNVQLPRLSFHVEALPMTLYGTKNAAFHAS